MRVPVYRAPRPDQRWVPLVAVLLLLGWPSPARSFGPSGHRLAGHIAEQHLCPATRGALRPLLGDQSLAEAGLWPDTIRRLPEWAHTQPWHYINVSDHGSVAEAARRTPDNVLAALERFEQQLGNGALSTRQRALALRFVAHFVVDLHQPLHVGREADRGGNLIPVLVGDRETNLHAVWDGEILGLARARARAIPAAQAARWQQASPMDWARESQALRPAVYAFPHQGAPPVALTPAYLARVRALLDRRLEEAGVRLAGRLNALLGPPDGCA